MGDYFIAICNTFLVLIYLYVAYTDFTRWKITNIAVLALLSCGTVLQLFVSFDGLIPALLSGALFFLIAFPFWLLRMTGAGDVKLLGATGFVIGFDDALELAVLMLASSLLFLAVISIVRRYILLVPVALSRSFSEILQRGKVPYGVPISLAAVTLLCLRILAWSGVL